MDDLTFFVATNHLRVRLQRLALHPDLWINSTESTLALEIKGLKSSMLKVAMRIESLKTKAARFDEVGGKLEADMDSIIAQAEDHTEDLSFAAQVLGNSTSGGSSGEGEHTDLKTEPPQDKAKSEPPAVGEPAKLTVNGIQA